MLKERSADANGETRVEVSLKPFLGMRPGAYLTVLYALLALAVLFFSFFSSRACATGACTCASAPLRRGLP